MIFSEIIEQNIQNLSDSEYVGSTYELRAFLEETHFFFNSASVMLQFFMK